jgi:RNA 2',3'-cyclic 3'-phosphodiesterase
LSSEAPEPTQRLFFALWPDQKQRQALARAAAKTTRTCGGRPVAATNLHVTLAFLGSVPQRRVPEAKAIGRWAADAFAQQAPLSLRFETLTHWRRPQILGALAADEGGALQGLAAALKDAAATAGFTRDLKPFHAHVTLARKVVHAPSRLALRPVVWRLDAFALVDSRTGEAGPVYSLVESYPLVKPEKARE